MSDAPETQWGETLTLLILAIAGNDPVNAAANIMRDFDVTPKGTRTMSDREILNQARSYWRLIRGAQNDMLFGRPDMAAMEEIALASAGMDEILLELLEVFEKGQTA